MKLAESVAAAVAAAVTVAAAIRGYINRKIKPAMDQARQADEKAEDALDRSAVNRRVLLDPANPEDDSLVEKVDETQRRVEEMDGKVDEIREMMREEHTDDS